MIRALPAALALVLSASPAAAAGEGGGAWELFWQGLNLAILIGFLVYFGRGPLRSALARRRNEIRENLESSARLLAEAEARLEEWKRRAARLEAQLEEIRETSRRLAEEEGERIRAQARAGAERLRRDAADAVAQELRRARGALRAEAADLAVELAGGLLRQQVSDADERRLFAEFVERVERARPGDGPGARE